MNNLGILLRLGLVGSAFSFPPSSADLFLLYSGNIPCDHLFFAFFFSLYCIIFYIILHIFQPVVVRW